MSRLHLFVFTCGRCGLRFKASGRSSNPNRHLIRGEGSGELAAIDVLSDVVFQQVAELVRELAHDEMTEARRGWLTKTVFARTACDPDTSGASFSYEVGPRCPRCNSNQIAEWVATEPAEFTEDNVRSVEHELWDAAGPDEQRSMVREAIADALSE